MGIAVHITLDAMDDAESFQVKTIQSISRRQAIIGTYKGLLAYIVSASALADDCLDDLSANDLNPDPDWCHNNPFDPLYPLDPLDPLDPLTPLDPLDPVPTPTMPGLGLAALSGLLLVLARKFYRR